ncbi:MAG: CpaE family protein [Ancalomicrobiaceae bacterium]|nr:CpaE family protein [Ancalomicrobiaceae bacterium]
MMRETPDDTAQTAEATPDIRPVPRIAVQAFCESREVAAVIEAAASDRRMAKAHVKVQMGGMNVAIEFYHGAPTPNLVIVESRVEREELLEQLDRLAEVCDHGTKVFVIGHVNDVPLFRELMRRGVSEYVVAPFGIFDFIRSIADLYSSTATVPLGRTIGFFGAKGGCGASTICHNVAWAITTSYDQPVVLVDLDMPFGTAGIDFNQDPSVGIADALATPDRIDDVFIDRLLTRFDDRLSILAAPATLDRTFDLGEMAIEPIVDVVRTSVPAVVVDIPHLWTSWAKRTLRQLDEVVIVAVPDLASLRNTKNVCDFLKQTRPNDAAPRLVINMVGMPKRPEIKPEDFARALELPILSVIPFEPGLFGTAANNGQMIAEVDPKHPIGETFRSIASIVTGRAEVRRQKKPSTLSFLSRLRGKATG